MSGTLTRLLTGTRALEAKLTSAFERTAQRLSRGAVSSPLEIVERAADALARQVHPAGRGRYVCPFNQVGLTVVAATDEDRARFEAILAGPPSLRDRLGHRLASAGCDEAELDVAVNYVATADPAWTDPEFRLSLGRTERLVGLELRIDLLVTHGTADRSAYSFTTLPIAIGRGAEVRDHRLQLVRVNHVAFTEDDEGGDRTVSRRHARIEVDAVSGRPRLIDDNSAQGTSIVRGGRGLPVPRGSRGLGLQSDDEIVLGQARLRVRITDAPRR